MLEAIAILGTIALVVWWLLDRSKTKKERWRPPIEGVSPHLHSRGAPFSAEGETSYHHLDVDDNSGPRLAISPQYDVTAPSISGLPAKHSIYVMAVYQDTDATFLDAYCYTHHGSEEFNVDQVSDVVNLETKRKIRHILNSLKRSHFMYPRPINERAMTHRVAASDFLTRLRAEPEMEIEYVDKNGEVTDRTIYPGAINTTDSHSYLRSFCFTADDMRTFRLDRINRACAVGSRRAIPSLEEYMTSRGRSVIHTPRLVWLD